MFDFDPKLEIVRREFTKNLSDKLLEKGIRLIGVNIGWTYRKKVWVVGVDLTHTMKSFNILIEWDDPYDDGKLFHKIMEYLGIE